MGKKRHFLMFGVLKLWRFTMKDILNDQKQTSEVLQECSS